MSETMYHIIFVFNDKYFEEEEELFPRLGTIEHLPGRLASRRWAIQTNIGKLCTNNYASRLHVVAMLNSHR